MPSSGLPATPKDPPPGRAHPSRHRNSARPRAPWRESLTAGVQFFGSFLRRPARVGSLVPSSRALARVMVAGDILERARVVVELGPGTGAFTGLILDRMSAGALFLAVELDEGHARRLQQRFAGARVIHGSAEHLPRYVRRLGAGAVDCVVSGLPWTNMKGPMQDRILQAITSVLSPEGCFATFSYIHARWFPGAVGFRSRLSRHFRQVAASRIVWRNLPPAVVYTCHQPCGDRLREPGADA